MTDNSHSQQETKTLVQQATEIPAVTLTEAAAKRIKSIISKDPAKVALRIAVDGGGCTGFSYRIELADGQNADDVLYEKDGAKLLIDEMSLSFMDHSIVDFVDDLIGQSFQIKNPNVVAACGCGTSFSV